MRLSELDLDALKVKENATSIYSDEEITSIIFDNVYDDGLYNEWCIVFGNSNQIEERIKTTIEAYKNRRFSKIVLCGGTKGISNIDKTSDISEASRIKKGLLEAGIPEDIIFLEETSENTFENIDNALKIISSDINSVSIITGEYHIKRVTLAFNKKYPNIKVTTIPSYDSYADKDNWYKGTNEWNSGRCIVIWERNLLTKYAKEGKIADIEIKNKNKQALTMEYEYCYKVLDLNEYLKYIKKIIHLNKLIKKKQLYIEKMILQEELLIEMMKCFQILNKINNEKLNIRKESKKLSLIMC